MLVGKDFEKIEWHFSGWDLLEPNAFIGDTLLFILALFFAFKIRKISKEDSFYNYWFWFFIVFGFSLFIGGLGHLFWNYWGITGKYFSWYSSIIAVFYIEQAMISLYPKKRIRLGLVNWSVLKLVLALIGLTVIINKVDVAADVSKGLLIPSINSAIGMILALVVLALHYQRIRTGNYKLFWIGVAILVPSAFFQFMKINFAPWFDRNDVSHVLLAITFVFYFIGVVKFKQNNAVQA